MKGTIADVHCPSCGAPARYDIIHQDYRCGYCGSRVLVREAQAEKQGFRRIQQQKIRSSSSAFPLMRANCSGCGAALVFREGEALSDCAFCGRALARQEYVQSEELPEMIIPFRITREEAAARLLSWCRGNALRPEARHLKDIADRIEGFYLPYELIRGPVSSTVSRMDSGRTYRCEGYVDNIFVNASAQIDNMLLDGMEPFELDDLRPFDFGWSAGQRIKIRDTDASELTNRTDREVSADYAPVVGKTLESKAVEIRTNASSVLRMPVLLPVYYIRSGETVAAVNGQTGKCSIRAEKPSHRVFLPWWLKAILATVLITGAAFGAFCLFGMALPDALLITGMLGLVIAIITLCAYSDTVRNRFLEEADHRIFTSSGGPFRREGTALVQDPEEIRKEVVPPVFFEKLDGEMKPVRLVFSSFRRRLQTALLAVTALFLPVIIALFLNGFDFGRLELGGSAVWFCIMVPVVPIYVLKFAVIERYERP